MCADECPECYKDTGYLRVQDLDINPTIKAAYIPDKNVRLFYPSLNAALAAWGQQIEETE